MRDLFEHVAVDGRVGGVEHPHRQQVVGVETDRLGDVELERGLPALVAPGVLAVQPDLPQVVHRAEAQQEAFRGEPSNGSQTVRSTRNVCQYHATPW